MDAPVLAVTKCKDINLIPSTNMTSVWENELVWESLPVNISVENKCMWTSYFQGWRSPTNKIKKIRGEIFVANFFTPDIGES